MVWKLLFLFFYGSIGSFLPWGLALIAANYAVVLIKKKKNYAVVGALGHVTGSSTAVGSCK